VWNLARAYLVAAARPKEGSGTRMLFSHGAPAIAWDAFAFAETLLTQPMMLVFGDKPGGFSAYRDGMENYGRAASKDKELVVVEGWSHYDLYDAGLMHRRTWRCPATNLQILPLGYTYGISQGVT